jgi:hypothetical protein
MLQPAAAWPSRSLPLLLPHPLEHCSGMLLRRMHGLDACLVNPACPHNHSHLPGATHLPGLLVMLLQEVSLVANLLLH